MTGIFGSLARRGSFAILVFLLRSITVERTEGAVDLKFAEVRLRVCFQTGELFRSSVPRVKSRNISSIATDTRIHIATLGYSLVEQALSQHSRALRCAAVRADVNEAALFSKFDISSQSRNAEAARAAIIG